jgi:hypothetical protein
MKEWQSYFYLDPRDLHPSNPGKAIGLIILLFSLILLVLWFFNIRPVSLYLIPIYMVFGVICLFIGRIIHYERQEEPPQKEEPHQGETEDFDDYESLMEKAEKEGK